MVTSSGMVTGNPGFGFTSDFGPFCALVVGLGLFRDYFVILSLLFSRFGRANLRNGKATNIQTSLWAKPECSPEQPWSSMGTLRPSHLRKKPVQPVLWLDSMWHFLTLGFAFLVIFYSVLLCFIGFYRLFFVVFLVIFAHFGPY